MKCIDQVIIYQNPDPLLVSRQAIFPGVVLLPNGDFLAMFAIGQAFDSADQRMYVCKSSDRGRTWSSPRRMHDHEFEPHEISETLKPLVLADGTLLATGYGFVRPDPLTPIVDPKTFEILPLNNLMTRSTDNGQTWATPLKVNIEGAQLEMSGPCIQLASGRILCACAPFHLGSDGHSGWVVYSDDNGKNWGKLSEFYRSENGEIAPWECRIVEMDPDHVAIIFWAYDTKNQENLTNYLVFSNDGGASFGGAVDTNILAQASNLIWLGDGKLLTIHSHREYPVGLWIRVIDVSGDHISIEQGINLLPEASVASDTKNISKQFGSLKFGQPALLQIGKHEFLATCWAVEDGQHVIKAYFLEL
ncbi:MAG: exo-alpha-sialidase [Rhizobiales bacterium]|nr:glycoside hydrolase [Hyphomicrobiales bacterium]NRB14319.1 exo-alpha-sialidase [Hyphomicrobiales bacterium]